MTIPKELDEAALIDGAGHPKMLVRIFMRVAMPGIIAATVFAFTVPWAGFPYPLAFIQQQRDGPDDGHRDGAHPGWRRRRR